MRHFDILCVGYTRPDVYDPSDIETWTTATVQPQKCGATMPPTLELDAASLRREHAEARTRKEGIETTASVELPRKLIRTKKLLFRFDTSQTA